VHGAGSRAFACHTTEAHDGVALERHDHRRRPRPGRRAGGLSGSDKSGTGGYGTRDDIAVLWPRPGAIVLSATARRNADPDDTVSARAAKGRVALGMSADELAVSQS
jgi:hypothetical protein